MLEFRLQAGANEAYVKRRSVRHGEFPTRAWEETEYRFNIDPEPEAPMRP